MCSASTFEAQNWGHLYLISDKADVIAKHGARSCCTPGLDKVLAVTMITLEHVVVVLAIRMTEDVKFLHG
jgi:hypothetical protein